VVDPFSEARPMRSPGRRRRPPIPSVERSPRDLQIDILLRAYAEGRQDDRNFIVVTLGLASVGVAVLAGVIWLVMQCSGSSVGTPVETANT
jgi:hypothetical protein